MRMWIIVVVCLVAIVAAFAFGRMYPSPDTIGELTEQVRLETIKQYEERIADLNKTLEQSVALYKDSQKKYDLITKKLKEIANGKENIKPPQSNDELNSRFTSLGYPPKR